MNCDQRSEGVGWVVWVREEVSQSIGINSGCGDQEGGITHKGDAKADAQVAQEVSPSSQTHVRTEVARGSGEEMRRFPRGVDKWVQIRNT